LYHEEIHYMRCKLDSFFLALFSLLAFEKKGGLLMTNELSDERRKAQIMVSYAMDNITKETLGNISQNKLDTCRAKINFIY